MVVNVASILGLFCGTQPKGYQYNTSKSAVVTLSRCIGNKVRTCTNMLRLYLCTMHRLAMRGQESVCSASALL